MKTVLHIGMSKTGSTSIQKTLTKYADRLASQGIVYPQLTRQPHHVYLVPAVLQEDEWKREFGVDTPENRARVVQSSERAWAKLADIVAEARTRGDTLIISCEHIIGLRRPALLRMIERLNSLGLEIAPKAYVRSPTSHFLSASQQLLKYSAQIKPPTTELRYRIKLNRFGDLPVEPLNVRVFARSQLEQERVVRDFLHNSTGVAIDSLGDFEVVSDNESLSAEGMALMQDFNQTVFPDGAPFGNALSKKVLALVGEADRAFGNTKPRLHDHLRALLARRHASDIAWLKEMHGLTFDDLGDIDLAGAPAIDAADVPALGLVSDLVTVDPDKLEQLTQAIFPQGARTFAETFRAGTRAA
ncbi:MAG: hypothetical protein KDK12_16105 [Rhodobacteraceae bacterium]|nr:hypothetical protein [Paracoccaceae bacterium]